MLCIDLDRFKAVNDTLGHPIGDALLKTVAERLLSCVRATDLIARLGGDEFADPAAGERGQRATPRCWRAASSSVLSAPYELDGQQVVIGASIGVAIAPQDGDTPDQLLKNADLALYRAKADGRGTHRFFEAAMDAELQARRAGRARPAQGARGRRVRALLPAAGQPGDRRDHRLRGAAALAPSGARPGSARRVHSASPRRSA